MSDSTNLVANNLLANPIFAGKNQWSIDPIGPASAKSPFLIALGGETSDYFIIVFGAAYVARIIRHRTP
jgi:hypothetical protein